MQTFMNVVLPALAILALVAMTVVIVRHRKTRVPVGSSVQAPSLIPFVGKKRGPLTFADLPIGTRVRYPFLDAKGDGPAVVVGQHLRKPELVTLRRVAAAPGDRNFSRRPETLKLAQGM